MEERIIETIVGKVPSYPVEKTRLAQSDREVTARAKSRGMRGTAETLNERRQIFSYSSTQLDSVPFAERTRKE